MPKDNPRIFISSTFTDLSEYRSAVRDAVLAAGAMPVLVEEVPVSASTVEDALRQALEGSDAVLIIVGFRYGAIDDKSGKSWVEAEYEAAKRRKKPILIFLASEDSSWPARLVDRDGRRVQEFRLRLASDQVVQVFSSPNELRAKVVQALFRWMALAESAPSTEPNRAPQKREITIIRLFSARQGMCLRNETEWLKRCSASIKMASKITVFS
jgi:hypothetical protein